MRSSCAGGRRARLAATYPSRIRHKVEALNPALWKFWAPKRAWGASGATGYLLLPKQLGEKGVVVGICVFRLLPNTPTFEVQHLPTNKRTDR
jgi:hypothetical protein